MGSHNRAQDRQRIGPGVGGVVYINCTLTVTECDAPRASHVVAALKSPYAPPGSTLDNVAYSYGTDSCNFRYGFAYPDVSGRDEQNLEESMRIMMTTLSTCLRRIWNEAGYAVTDSVGPERYTLNVAD